MSLSTHVSISISEDSTAVPRAGFGTALLLSDSAGWVERVREYASLAEVAADFAVTTSPEYLVASAYFGQSPRPDKLKIGRCALPATKTFTLTPTAVNSTAYSITVHFEGGVSETVTYTSDATATVAEITLGLTNALNAVVSKNFTAVDGTTVVTVDADAAGDWFSLEVLDRNLIDIVEDHADPGVATDLTAIETEDADWYCLLTTANSEAYVKAAAAWIEARKKIYLFDVCDTISVNTASDGTQGTLDDLATLNYARTGGSWHPRPAEFLSAAWAGRVLPKLPGSTTWTYKELVGVSATQLTSTERGNLDDRNANYYKVVSTKGFVWEGKMADGDYIDIQRGLDWLEDDVSKTVFENLLGPDKVPFTDQGVSTITSAIRASLQRAVDRGVLAGDPEPTVTAPKVADVSAANKTARTLPDVRFGGTLAGAIHKVTLTGTVSV